MASWLSFLAKPLYRVLVNPNWHLIIRKGCSTLARTFAFIFSKLIADLFRRGSCLNFFTLPGRSDMSHSALTPCVFSRFSAPK